MRGHFRVAGGLALVAVLCATGASYADEPESEAGLCETPELLDKYGYLRRASLDLRHRAPDYEEYIALDEHDDVPAEWLAEWVAGGEYLTAMRRLHESWLWTNPSGAAVFDGLTLVRPDQRGIWDIFSQARRATWRGQPISCADYEQTEFDEDGRPIAEPVTDDDGNPVAQQEGWVEIAPYWAPDQLIKVCAFVAMETAQGNQSDCDFITGGFDPGCGCGGDLRRCASQESALTVFAAMREQLLRAVDDAVLPGSSYTSLLTSRGAWRNGPLDHWAKYQAHLIGLSNTFNWWSEPDGELPENPDFTDREWRVVDRGGPHAGIITLPAYTLRFQTNRARANHFRIVFEGLYFTPPASTEDTGCSETTDDLTERCVCRYCHQLLEPSAAHFADIAEAGSAVVDASFLPLYNPQCDGTQVPPQQQPAFCPRFYATEPEAARPGWRLTHQYADPLSDSPLHSQIAANIDAGPAALVDSVMGSGAFARSTVRAVFRYLVGRDLVLSGENNEADKLETWASQLETTDDFSALVLSIVGTDDYRRVR